MKVSIFVVGLSMDDVLLPLIISNCCMQHLDAGFVRCSPEMQFPRLNLPVQLKMQSPESKSTSAICSISNSMYSLRSYVAMSAATGRRQVSQGQAEHQLVVDRDRCPVAVEKGGGGGEGGSSTLSVCHEWVVRPQCRTGRALHHMRHSAAVGHHAYRSCVMLIAVSCLSLRPPLLRLCT